MMGAIGIILIGLSAMLALISYVMGNRKKDRTLIFWLTVLGVALMFFQITE